MVVAVDRREHGVLIEPSPSSASSPWDCPVVASKSSSVCRPVPVRCDDRTAVRLPSEENDGIRVNCFVG